MKEEDRKTYSAFRSRGKNSDSITVKDSTWSEKDRRLVVILTKEDHPVLDVTGAEKLVCALEKFISAVNTER